MRQEIVAAFKRDDKDVWIEIVVRKKVKKRSTEQNAYYWSVLIPMVCYGMNQLGNNDIQPSNKEHQGIVHDYLKKMFVVGGEFVDMHGEVHKLDPRTSKLTTTEFMHYISEVIKWSGEMLGITIPAPDEKIIVKEGEMTKHIGLADLDQEKHFIL